MARLTGAPGPSDLRRLLGQPGCSPGTFLGLASPSAAEIAGLAGMEWVVLDLEHGGATLDQVGPTVQAAAGHGVAVIVRVPQPKRSIIGWVLDQGAAGVMVPRIESAEHAAEVSSYLAYPPAGQRGVASYTRAAGWGTTRLSDLDTPVYMPQIETAGALADVEQIAQMSEVDALFIGPLDLSFALGHPQELDHPEFVEAFSRIVQAGSNHHTPVGSIAPNRERSAWMRDQGLAFLALGSDSLWLREALSQSVRELNQTETTER